MAKQIHLIKITSKGKVSIAISESLKGFFLSFLESVQQHNHNMTVVRLDDVSAPEKMRLALINEVYMRHYTMLSMLGNQGRLLVTLPQALALWTYAQDYQNEVRKHPELGNLFMQLHQKLS